MSSKMSLDEAVKAVDTIIDAWPILRERIMETKEGESVCTEPKGTLVWTDGSCIKNPGGGGAWGYIIKHEGTTLSAVGTKEETTNNEMELMAIQKALMSFPTFVRNEMVVTVYTDSKYAQGVLMETYKYKKNVDLIKETIGVMHEFESVDILWVKGHADNEMNKKVDKMVGDATKEMK